MTERDLSNLAQRETQRHMSELITTATRILDAEANAVRSVVKHLDEAFEQAVKSIAESQGMLVVAGIGKSGFIGQKISATFASIGTPSHFVHPTEAAHGDLGRIRANDILLLMSYGGETEEVLALAAMVRQDGVKIISMTGRPDSHLAKISDIHLNVGDINEACPHNLAPTASTTAMLAFGDALALAVSEYKAFTAEDYKKRHPGGTLGRQMLGVTEIMRFKAGDNLPLIRDDVTIGTMLEQAANVERRSGAVVLIDEHGKLSGIFTDADLRRLLLKQGADALATSVASVMTRQPRCLKDSEVVRDAVQLVREVRVDEIPVVDEQNKPVGLVDVQDLISLKLIASDD